MIQMDPAQFKEIINLLRDWGFGIFLLIWFYLLLRKS